MKLYSQFPPSYPAFMQWFFALLAWLGFAVMAVLLGVVRVRLAEPRMGERAAHVVFTLLFCMVLFGGIAAFVRKVGFDGASSRWMLGLVWMLLTIAFEFLFGHFVAGHSWQALLADYNVLRGRIWALVLLTLLLGPRLAGV